jgi:hypothetical protein
VGICVFGPRFGGAQKQTIPPFIEKMRDCSAIMGKFPNLRP